MNIESVVHVYVTYNIRLLHAFMHGEPTNENMQYIDKFSDSGGDSPQTRTLLKTNKLLQFFRQFSLIFLDTELLSREEL